MKNFFKIRVNNSKTKFTTYSGEVVDGKFKITDKVEAVVDSEEKTSSFEEHKMQCRAGQNTALILASPEKSLVGKSVVVVENKLDGISLEDLKPKTPRKPRTRKPKSKDLDGDNK